MILTVYQGARDGIRCSGTRHYRLMIWLSVEEISHLLTTSPKGEMNDEWRNGGYNARSFHNSAAFISWHRNISNGKYSNTQKPDMEFFIHFTRADFLSENILPQNIGSITSNFINLNVCPKRNRKK